MPILLYNLELTEQEIVHLWALLAMRTLNLGPISLEEISMLEKIEEFMNQ
jgi:hypothetical protein